MPCASSASSALPSTPIQTVSLAPVPARCISLTGSLPTAIRLCGPAVTTLLRTCLARLNSDDRSSQSLLQIQQHMKSLLDLADENINAVPFTDVRLEWLRLYTDASIGVALIAIQSTASNGVHDVDWWKEVVRQLDMAIIVAGAPGVGRKAIIQDLIKEIQPRTTEEVASSSKRRRLNKSPMLRQHWPLLFAPHPIPVMEVPPSIMAFTSTHHLQPFIIRRYFIEDLPWKAMQRWSSASDLLSHVGLGRVVPVEIGRSYTDAGWGQQIIPFERFLRLVGYPDAPPASGHDIEEDKQYIDRPIYLAQHALFMQFPDLERDFCLPDYVYSEPPATPDMPEYTPPGNEDNVVVNVWIGGGKNEVISPAHTVRSICYHLGINEVSDWPFQSRTPTTTATPKCLAINVYG